MISEYRVALSGAKMYVCNHLVCRLPSHAIRLFLYRRFFGFNIGHASSVLMATRFYGSGKFTMGSNSVINDGCRIDNRAGVNIGVNVSISSECAIMSADHNVRDPLLGTRLRGVTIHDFAFIGIRATILPGVTIGCGAVVGAGAVVTRDVPPGAIVAGVPARVVGHRPGPFQYELRYRPIFQ